MSKPNQGDNAGRLPRGVRLVIFDADDTLRRTLVPGQPCPHRSGEWELLPGVRERLSRLPWGGGGLLIGVASNQDQVGYGHLSEAEAKGLLRDAVVAATGYDPPSEAIQCCPHALEEPCTCRKPGPGMLERIIAHYGVAPSATLVVGDSPNDAEAARRAGAAFRQASEFFGWETVP